MNNEQMTNEQIFASVTALFAKFRTKTLRVW